MSLQSLWHNPFVSEILKWYAFLSLLLRLFFQCELFVFLVSTSSFLICSYLCFSFITFFRFRFSIFLFIGLPGFSLFVFYVSFFLSFFCYFFTAFLASYSSCILPERRQFSISDSLFLHCFFISLLPSTSVSLVLAWAVWLFEARRRGGGKSHGILSTARQTFVQLESNLERVSLIYRRQCLTQRERERERMQREMREEKSIVQSLCRVRLKPNLFQISIRN